MQKDDSQAVITGEDALAILLGFVDLETLEELEYVRACGVGSLVDGLALKDEGIKDQFSACLAAFSSELNKGKLSALKLDYALSNETDIYITLESFRAWASGKALPARLPGGAQSTLAGPRAAPTQSTPTPPRTKQREQEDAILDEIRRLGFDPLALPARSPGKAGVKAIIRKALDKKAPFDGKSTFGYAWERLRADGLMREVDPTPPK